MCYIARLIGIAAITLRLYVGVSSQNWPPTCVHISRPNALQFSCNDFTQVPIDYRLPDDTLNLIITGDQMYPAKLVQLLGNMVLLQSLSLSHIALLTVMLNDTFQNLRNLSTLELFDVPHLTRIQSGIFANLTNLRILIFREVKRIQVEEATTALKSLKSRHLHTLVFDKLQLTSESSPFIVVKKGFFKTLGYFPLKTLVFTRNNVIPVFPGFSKHIPNITCFIFQSNGAKGINRATTIDILALEHLRYFDVSYQFRHHDVYHYPPLNETCLEPFPNGVRKTHLESTMIKQAEDTLESMCHTVYRLPTELRFSFVNDIYAGSKVNSANICVHPSNNLRYIDLSHNSVDSGRYNIGFVRLEYIRAQFCQLSSLPYHAFAHFPSLRYLLIGGNNLKKWFRTGNATSALPSLSNLESVDLASCHIDYLSAVDLHNILRIPMVNLSNNILGEDSLAMQSPVDMKFSFLNLSSNVMRTLPSQLRQSFEKVFRENPEVLVDLSGNPFVCDCGTLEFISWMADQSKHFEGFDQYVCSFKSQNAYLSNITNRLDQLMEDCQAEIRPGIAVISSVVFVSLLVSLMFIGYKWRRQFCYAWFRFFLKIKTTRMWLKGYKLLSNEGDYQYDTFVIYSHKDGDWVIDQLRPALEATGVCLCIGERDFDVGILITDAVAWSLSNSRCAVLVLSSNLLGSKWCEYEVTMALILSHKVIVVCVEDVPYNRLPPAIYYLMKTRTRLVYKEGHERQNEFWEKLVASVKPPQPAL